MKSAGATGIATVVGLLGIGLAVTGYIKLPGNPSADASKAKTTEKPKLAPPLAVTVVPVQPGEIVETLLATGSLIPRDEILVGPEVEGLRVVEILADEGDRVLKGQVLARLVTNTLDAQLAQNTASLAKADAAIAQARSTIASAEAKLVEASNAYDRGQPLTKSGYLAASGMDQRASAKLTSEAALASARDGLKVSEAERAQVEAQRRELDWKRTRTEIQSPADGLISRRTARIGSYATGAADAMFRLVARGEIELDAEVPESRIASLRIGQKAVVSAASGGEVEGTVRLVSPEVDKTTRLGRVRIFIGDKPGLRIGAFARARIETARSRGLVVPSTAVLHGPGSATVQVVADGRVATRKVRLGLVAGASSEVLDGLSAGEMVVVRSGTFLRDGDPVRAVPARDAADQAG